MGFILYIKRRIPSGVRGFLFMAIVDTDKKRLTRITTAPLLTPYLRAEVEALGFVVQDEDAVGVHVGATLGECARLCLHLRTGMHVMWLLKRFRCPSPKALYRHVASFPWEELIDRAGYFSVSSSVDNPKITNSMYPNLVVKDAIVDRISKQMGERPDSGPDKSKVVINLYWKGERAWLYLNVNGRRLADRGYRRMPHSAPMQETLAAGVLACAGYDGSQTLVNPMCGAGTIAIEAALIASGRAPGLLRSNFSFMHTKLFDEDSWKTMRIEAKKSGNRGIRHGENGGGGGGDGGGKRIIASDHDERAMYAARKNAATAGVEHLIEFVQCDFADTPIPEGEAGMIIMNPEYGNRLGEIEELTKTYGLIGDFFKKRCAGWSGFVFTGNRELAKKIGLRASRRVPFVNAKIDCRLLEYEMYAGSLRE